jgi:hypothetical protein
MGFNSVVVVLNDRLHEIERDPEFGKKVANAIRAYDVEGRIPKPYITGQTQVVSVQHADVVQIVAVGANTARVLGYGHWRQSNDEIIKDLNSQRLRRAKETEASTAKQETA